MLIWNIKKHESRLSSPLRIPNLLQTCSVHVGNSRNSAENSGADCSTVPWPQAYLLTYLFACLTRRGLCLCMCVKGLWLDSLGWSVNFAECLESRSKQKAGRETEQRDPKPLEQPDHSGRLKKRKKSSLFVLCCSHTFTTKPHLKQVHSELVHFQGVFTVSSICLRNKEYGFLFNN